MDIAAPIVAEGGKTRRRKRDKATRDEILLAAANLIVDKGFMACTMRSISEQVNIQAGSLYHHFASKDEIVVEIMNSGTAMLLEQVRQSVEELDPGTPFARRLEIAMRTHLVCKLDRDLPFMRVYEQLMPVTKRQGRQMRRKYAELWIDMIEQGKRSGEVRRDIDSVPFVSYLLSSLNSTPDWFSAEQLPREELIDMIQTVVERGILVQDLGG
ncbi:MAG: TetR/AcrR family transcriptional regulator [Amaricoccus sp.]|uniref:TetR/AcrR family transcriptional regulator n=1 Tax=Amaricoccus sp. TaxID=1872485 RepID=UPI0039E6EBEC